MHAMFKPTDNARVISEKYATATDNCREPVYAEYSLSRQELRLHCGGLGMIPLWDLCVGPHIIPFRPLYSS